MSTELQKVEKSPYLTVKSMLERAQGELVKSLPSHLNPDRFMRLALTMAQKNPKLLECSARSIVASVLEAAQLGLELDGTLGHAYLVPYWDKNSNANQAQLQVGYRGMLSLAYRSGMVNSVDVVAVYQGDEFSEVRGTSPEIRHVCRSEVRDAEHMTHVYAVAHLSTSGTVFDVMNRGQVDAIMARTKGQGKYGPWKTDYEQMAMKTVLRRLAKRLPLSPEHLRAVVADEYREAGIPAPPVLDAAFDPVTGETSDSPGKTGLDAVVEAVGEVTTNKEASDG